MNNFPKLLIITGSIIILIGLIWMIGGRFFNFGRMPGDIVVEKENVKFYFPVVTCIVISIVASFVLYIARWFMK